MSECYYGNDLLNFDKINCARKLAEQAIKARKVFRLDGGHRYMRKALKARGWVEKFTPRTKRFQTGDDGDEPVDRDDDPVDDNENESKDPNEIKTLDIRFPVDETDQLVSRALRDHEPDFQWVPTRRIDYNSIRRDIWVNHFHRADFVTKTGLTQRLESLRWHSDRHPDEFYPRCYVLGQKDSNENFQEDFRRCAASSFLKNCADQYKDNLNTTSYEKLEKKWLPAKWIDFAIDATNNAWTNRDGSTNASTIYRNVAVSEEDLENKARWTEFLEIFYLVAHSDHYVTGVEQKIQKIEKALELEKQANVQSKIEGKRNLWIIKPGAMSRGRGISVYSNLNKINELIGPDLNIIANEKWVAQKYIERPLLIRNVKFDIRQWFLVTDWEQLTVWMYKRSYLRFATVPFTLDNLDGQIHLTNAAIQKNFEISDECQGDIPEEKMWYSEELDAHLREQGYGDAFEKKIFPAMRDILIQTCLAGQETAEPRKRSFELYGADFMLDEDLNPHLIEVNQGPTLSIATAVTKDLVESLLEDICKVILDKPRDYSYHETGDFVRIFRQQVVGSNFKYCLHLGNALHVDGKGYKKPKPPAKSYIKEFKISKKKGDGDDGDDDEEIIINKSYSWDVERINRLAQPRNRGRDSSTPPDEKNSKTSDISVKPEKTKTFQIRQINKNGESTPKVADVASATEYTSKLDRLLQAEKQISGRINDMKKQRDVKSKVDRPHSTTTVVENASMKIQYKSLPKSKSSYTARDKPSSVLLADVPAPKWNVILHDETIFEDRPSVVPAATRLPPTRLRLQRERTSSDRVFLPKKVTVTPTVYRVRGLSGKGHMMTHDRPYGGTIDPLPVMMPLGAISSGKIIRKDSRYGVLASLSGKLMKKSPRFNDSSQSSYRNVYSDEPEKIRIQL